MEVTPPGLEDGPKNRAWECPVLVRSKRRIPGFRKEGSVPSMRADPRNGTRDGGVVLAARESRRLLWKRIRYYRRIYLLMVLPTLALTIMFRYLTLPGIFLSFLHGCSPSPTSARRWSTRS